MRFLAQLLSAGLLVTLPLAPPARAQSSATLMTLRMFSRIEGSLPQGSLLQAADGNFYGTTSSGGSGGQGTVFRITPTGELTVLHSFVTTDGASPDAGLVQGADGNFYGTTSGGGSGIGTVFQITPAGALSTLHNFNLTDGDLVTGKVTIGSDGNFYGTTQLSGPGSVGTVFQLTPEGDLTTLHAFNNSGTNGDGSRPVSGVTEGRDGNFYGTTLSGGVDNRGTIYKITPDGTFTTLHAFAVSIDGQQPETELALGNDGSFYGVASSGPTRGGVVYRVTPEGDLSVLHAFSNQYPGSNNGYNPRGILVEDSAGNFYGITTAGGTSDHGTVYQLSPDGVLTTLYSFTGGGDGGSPFGGLVQGSDGNYYGTTSTTVFKLTLHPGFFTGAAPLGDGAYYLAFSQDNYFGYYSFLDDPNYLYHYDLGYEYVFDAHDGKNGVYLYDFASRGFFYTSSAFPFPYLYDFSLNTVLYYYPDLNSPGRYNTNGIRYFYRFDTGEIFSK